MQRNIESSYAAVRGLRVGNSSTNLDGLNRPMADAYTCATHDTHRTPTFISASLEASENCDTKSQPPIRSALPGRSAACT
jgi:hypothetical protein